MYRVARSRQLCRTLLFTMMVTLLLAQTLGSQHRVVHAPGGAVQASHADIVHAAPAHPDWRDALFAGHEQAGCDSYDQLSHADFLWGASVESTAWAQSPTPPGAHPSSHLAAQAAGYLARGPPERA